jgi:hypothetical protein
MSLSRHAKTDASTPPDEAVPAGETSRVDAHGEAVLYQYDRCCDDWRHHDAIIWEMPLAAVTADAVIVWAAHSNGSRLQLTAAWLIAGLVVGVMAIGLRKQVGYARQIQVRIKEIEAQFGLPTVTHPVGRPGLVSGAMIWLLRLLALFDLCVALLYVVAPDVVL